MKKKIIFILFLISFFTTINAQKLLKKESEDNKTVKSSESFQDLSAEEAEEQMFEMRRNNSSNYKPYLNPAESSKQSNQVWNAYFNYLKQQGPTVFSAHGSWTNIGCSVIDHTVGKATSMGRVHCVRTDPNNANIVYAGVPDGGLWKSIDGGDNWTCLTDGLPRIGIADVAINPNNSNEIYLLTGDGDARLCPSIGVLKSYNGGYTWVQTNFSFNLITGSYVYGYKLIINPVNPSILFAATSAGVYKTSDGFNTYTHPISTTIIFDINFKPGFPDTVYACSTNSLYKSTNGGNSFSSPALVDNMSARLAMSTTIVAPGNIYLLAAVTVRKARVYVSTNSGDTFLLKSDTTNGIWGQVSSDIAIEASPTNASTIYAGVLQVYKSTNQGTTINIVSAGGWGSANYVHADVHDIEIRNGIIYVACDGGIYKSTDGGITWTEKTNGLSVAWITSIAHIPTFPNLFYFGSFDNGMLKRSNGNSCKALAHGDGFNCLMDYTDSNTCYGLINGILYKTTNGGNNYMQLGVPSDSGEWVRCLDMHPTNHSIIYAACNDVYKSIDSGMTWTPTHADSTYGRSTIAVAKSNPNYVYSATRAGTSFTSSPNLFQKYNGTSWSSAKGNLPSIWTYDFSVTGMCVDPNDFKHIWVTFWGTTNVQNRIFETSDSGATWANKTGTIPWVNINCIAMTPGGNNEVYIGTDIGVFYRSNSYSDWIPFMNGLPRVAVTDISIDPLNNSIYAATCGRGLWQSDLYSSCPASLVFSGTPYNTQYGYHFYETSDFIISDRFIDGSYGNDITYKANNYINFIPGFEAVTGCEFKAEIGPCSGFPAPIPITGNYEEEQYLKLQGTTKISLNASPVDENLKIYPQPYNDFVTIDFVSENDLPVTIVITDILGHTIESIIKNESFAAGKHSFQISTVHHKSGIYAVTFKQGGKIVTKKIVKL